MSSHCALSPLEWDRTLSGSPDLCSAASAIWSGALLRRWRGTAAGMEQPPLDQHYLVLHLGGPKRVTRRAGGSVTTAEVEPGAITLVPAGVAGSWATEGPIAFAHLYVQPKMVDRAVQEDFDRDPRSVALLDFVGRDSPLLSALLLGMMDQVASPSFASRLVLDTLLHTLVIRLLCQCSTLPQVSRVAPHSLPPRRLRRVLDFIEANLTADIALDDLAGVAGGSRYHFSRAFRDATGIPPYRYLVNRRIEAAKAMLLEDTLSITEVAVRCGFNSQSHFAAMFRQVFGTSPGRFRREH